MGMSDLSIRLFASLKDRAQQGQIVVSLEGVVTVEDLLALVSAEFPHLASALPSTLVAVNRAYADEQTVVSATDEVAFFPPVSGG